MSFASLMATLAFFLLVVSAIVQVVWLLRHGSKADPFTHWLLLAAAGLLGAEMTARSFEIGFFALTNMYESLAFYALAIALVVFGYRMQKRLAYNPGVAFGSTMIAIILMMVASSPLIPKDALPPIPALRSNWLLLHVSFSFIGEAFFVMGFITAILFLATKDEKRRLDFDRLTYTTIGIGYVFFTAGALAFGAIWAEQAWGRWWSWDPKETWALVTWLVYTVYLHVRLIMKRKDSLPAVISVVGFLCTVFTFFGVNYLLPGLHSYG